LGPGRRTPLPAVDRRRAGHRPRGKPNLGVEGHLARDLRRPDPPPRPGLSRTRRHRRSADRRRPSRRTAATLTRPEQAERARANPALEQRKSNLPVPADRGSSAACQEEMRPRKGQADDAHAGVWGLSGDTRSRSIDLLDSAARTRCPADLVGDADHTLPGRVGPKLPTTNRTQVGGDTGKGKSNHGCL
jgi:hypothetical protein